MRLPVRSIRRGYSGNVPSRARLALAHTNCQQRTLRWSAGEPVISCHHVSPVQGVDIALAAPTVRTGFSPLMLDNNVSLIHPALHNQLDNRGVCARESVQSTTENISRLRAGSLDAEWRRTPSFDRQLLRCSLAHDVACTASGRTAGYCDERRVESGLRCCVHARRNRSQRGSRCL